MYHAHIMCAHAHKRSIVRSCHETNTFKYGYYLIAAIQWLPTTSKACGVIQAYSSSSSSSIAKLKKSNKS